MNCFLFLEQHQKKNNGSSCWTRTTKKDATCRSAVRCFFFLLEEWCSSWGFSSKPEEPFCCSSSSKQALFCFALFCFALLRIAAFCLCLSTSNFVFFCLLGTAPLVLFQAKTMVLFLKRRKQRFLGLFFFLFFFFWDGVFQNKKNNRTSDLPRTTERFFFSKKLSKNPKKQQSGSSALFERTTKEEPLLKHTVFAEKKNRSSCGSFETSKHTPCFLVSENKKTRCVCLSNKKTKELFLWLVRNTEVLFLSLKRRTALLFLWVLRELLWKEEPFCCSGQIRRSVVRWRTALRFQKRTMVFLNRRKLVCFLNRI